jgi:hypothetical protein
MYSIVKALVILDGYTLILAPNVPVEITPDPTYTGKSVEGAVRFEAFNIAMRFIGTFSTILDPNKTFINK